MHKAQRHINHVALVLDGSGSMNSHKRKLIEVADEQIRHLARRSEELSQETRVSVYVFDSTVECVLFDMDVMRLPSIADLYWVRGTTALIDATIKSQQDLATTSQIYGDHAFLTSVLTDGAENASRNRSSALSALLATSAENWSVGFLVPNEYGVNYVKNLGVDAGSIARWDAANAAGVVEAAGKIKDATESFMTNRAKGIRGTRSVFSTGLDAVNKTTVSQNLTPMNVSDYQIYPVENRSRIDEFVRGLGLVYVKGKAFYQLTKTETIQPQKQLVVVDRKNGRAYSGPQARHIVGLRDGVHERVRPDHNPDYDIYVQSTSLNRNLMPNTRLLVMS